MRMHSNVAVLDGALGAWMSIGGKLTSKPTIFERAVFEPNPNNNMVFTEVVPPTVTAVIRFSGRANADLLGRKTAELMNWIDELGYVAKETPRYMFYNDPSTPPFLRRNEVMIAVQ